MIKIRYEAHQIVASGDHAAMLAPAHGLHNSDHLGFAATGQPRAMPPMHLFRADGDRLPEHRGVRDELSVPALPQLEISGG